MWLVCYLSLFRLRVWGHCVFEPLSSLAVPPPLSTGGGPLIQATGVKDKRSFAPVAFLMFGMWSRTKLRLEKFHFEEPIKLLSAKWKSRFFSFDKSLN
ncbi:hypothetical protein A6X21_09045 [Planctopirus hydrillae]|uniref:Uncharacterized protein n=1 Tax=Planctopirus hydrillae TaxID=1841610 RepID=A0A1C3E7M9_9PLAN|nr:hypothetical protein A6X21_09045 [Planctopirus hydrillae]